MVQGVRFRVKGTRDYVEPMERAARLVHASAGGGGSTAGRLARWTPPTDGPNSGADLSLSTMRSRSRQMVAQNGMAQNGVDALVANLIGTGIAPQFVTSDAALNADLAAAFLEWTDEADADGQFDFYGLQALAVRSMIEGGDVFTRLRTRLKSDGLSVPFQLQVLEAEYCPEGLNRRLESGRIRAGVEFNGIGRRVAYHLYRSHPGDFADLSSVGTTVRVDAGEIAQLAMTRRPGQVRGEPWLARALVKLRDLDKYDDAQLVRQQIAALFAGFVSRKDDVGEQPQRTFEGEGDADEDGVALASLEPGTMQVLEDGQSVSFAAPPSPGDSYESFMRQQSRLVAVSLGILYEQATGDYSQLNDRTFRAAVNEFRRRCEMLQHHNVVFQFCRPVLRRWVDLAVLARRIRLPAGISVATAARAKWVPQGWAYINPVQDVQAKVSEVRAGLRSRSMVVSADGYDAAAVDAEIAADNARADGLGIILETDPRRTSGSGASQAKPAGSEFIAP